MVQAAAFAVSNFAVTTASAKSSSEATTRALSLYRQWQRSVTIHKKILRVFTKLFFFIEKRCQK